MYKIAVIVPIYNCEKTLEKCIRSILNQSFTNFQLILVNDGSTDKSLQICQAFKDDRILIINQDNQGVSAARNIGIKMSNSEFIMFTDSDDYIKYNMIEYLINEQNNFFDLVICGYNIVFNHKIIEKKCINKKINQINKFGNDFSYLYLNGFINSPCNKIYKKILIKHFFKEDMNMGEDLIFNLNYIKNCRNVCCISYSLYNYVINDSISLSKKYNDNLLILSKQLHSAVVSCCNSLFDNYDVQVINLKFLEDCFSVTQKIVTCTNLSKTDILLKISEIYKDKNVINILKKCKTQNMQYKLYLYLLKKKQAVIIYWVLKIKFLLKGFL